MEFFLRIMTFNLRFENDQDTHQPWEKRKELILQIIKDRRPHILGTQEGRLRQLLYLSLKLKGYRMPMKGRTLDPLSQYPTLFISNDLQIVECGEFWLSNSPQVHLSKDWDSAFPRMISYAFLRPPGVEKTILVATTHLDNKGALARQMQSRIILNWVKNLDPIPMILMGDFNEGPDGDVHKLLCQEGGFLDTWILHHKEEGKDSFSYHGFTGIGGLARLDWLLVRLGSAKGLEVLEAEFIKVKKGSIMPSDHFPYHVSLKLRMG